MKYFFPVKMDDEEIVKILGDKCRTSDSQFEAVMSAVYFSDNIEFVGDLLLEGFVRSDLKEKLIFKEIFETFYQFRRTCYRIDDAIRLLSDLAECSPNFSKGILEAVGNLAEYKGMFSVSE